MEAEVYRQTRIFSYSFIFFVYSQEKGEKMGLLFSMTFKDSIITNFHDFQVLELSRCMGTQPQSPSGKNSLARYDITILTSTSRHDHGHNSWLHVYDIFRLEIKNVASI